MSKQIEEKLLDIRTVDRNIKNGLLTQKDVDQYNKNIPNDEDNFELIMIEEDDIGIGDTLTEEELKSMPAITEENIDNFDFMEKEESEEEIAEKIAKDIADE